MLKQQDLQMLRLKYAGKHYNIEQKLSMKSILVFHRVIIVLRCQL